jgi:hypothetical protein
MQLQALAVVVAAAMLAGKDGCGELQLSRPTTMLRSENAYLYPSYYYPTHMRFVVPVDTFKTSAASVAFESVPIFKAYAGYPPCYRQPSLVVVNSQTILAFVGKPRMHGNLSQSLQTLPETLNVVVDVSAGADCDCNAEGRNNTYCSGTNDGFPFYIYVKRSADAGVTWSPQQLLFNGSADYLAGMYDPVSDLVHLFVQINGGSVALFTSADRGVTFGPYRLVQLSDAACGGAIPTCGHGIVVDPRLCLPSDPTCGGKAGRLVMPVVCHNKAITTITASAADVACPGCYSGLAVSDDAGATWQVTAVSQQEGTRESTAVQLLASSGAPGPSLYVSERNMGNATGNREYARSDDGGSSFSMHLEWHRCRTSTPKTGLASWRESAGVILTTLVRTQCIESYSLLRPPVLLAQT